MLNYMITMSSFGFSSRPLAHWHCCRSLSEFGIYLWVSGLLMEFRILTNSALIPAAEANNFANEIRESGEKSGEKSGTDGTFSGGHAVLWPARYRSNFRVSCIRSTTGLVGRPPYCGLKERRNMVSSFLICWTVEALIKSTDAYTNAPSHPKYNPFWSPNSNTFLDDLFSDHGIDLNLSLYGPSLVDPPHRGGGK